VGRKSSGTSLHSPDALLALLGLQILRQMVPHHLQRHWTDKPSPHHTHTQGHMSVPLDIGISWSTASPTPPMSNCQNQVLMGPQIIYSNLYPFLLFGCWQYSVAPPFPAAPFKDSRVAHWLSLAPPPPPCCCHPCPGWGGLSLSPPAGLGEDGWGHCFL
jgi:hypothetical protein